MINLIPMAGLGKRFVDAGYQLPKPLLPVGGKSMIARVISMLPAADRWVFVVRKEHIDDHLVIDVIRKEVPRAEFVVAKENTSGQLSTCLLARDFVEDSDGLFIASCDQGFIWNRKKFEELKGLDVVPWVFTKHSFLADNPRAWGWVKSNEQGMVQDVSVKVPVSGNPIEDFALTGAFYFREGATFLKLADDLIERDEWVNGEFYVDSLVGLAPKKGFLAKQFVVDKYVCWGTPRQYEEFLFWSDVFKELRW